jgi:signal transduction histidine kinase
MRSGLMVLDFIRARIHSIRSRILWILLPLLAVTLMITASMVYFISRAELSDALNAQLNLLSQSAAGLQGDQLAYPTEDGDDWRDLANRIAHEGDFLIVIRDGAGTDLYNSKPYLDLPSNLKPGSYRMKLKGRAWHLVVRQATTSGKIYITGRFEEEAREIIWQLVGTAIVPLSVVFILTLIIAVLSLHTGLAPLVKLSRHLETRPPNKLDAIDVSDQPKEIKPIIEALNGLFERIERFIKRERQFVDDAAHEIRTPLTVIKAQAQAINPEGMSEANLNRLNHITSGIDRVARLSKQLLQQARAEKEAGAPDKVDVQQMAIALVGEFDGEASQQSVTLEVDCPEDLEPQALVNRDDLWTILRNLMENAIRYCDRPGEVVISLRSDDAKRLSVCIEDNGPGIPSAERGQIFERFYRGDSGKSGSDMAATEGAGHEGAGLGLSIVKSLVDRNDMDLSIEDSKRLGGAAFCVTVPCPEKTS